MFTTIEISHTYINASWQKATDVIESKIFKPPPLKHNHKPTCKICKIFLDNKGTELINSRSLLYDLVLAFLVI